MKVKFGHSCPTLRGHGLYSPWDSPGQNTGVGCHLLAPDHTATKGQVVFQSTTLCPCDIIKMDRTYQCSDFSSSHKETTEQPSIGKTSLWKSQKGQGETAASPRTAETKGNIGRVRGAATLCPHCWCTGLPNGRAESPRSTPETHLKAVEHILPQGQGLSRHPRPTIEQSRCPTLPGNGTVTLSSLRAQPTPATRIWPLPDCRTQPAASPR